MEMITPALCSPTVWLNAPRMPTARYTVGAMVRPLMPTWSCCGSQPSWNTSLVMAMLAPIDRAISWTLARFSTPPTPIPTPSTTGALAKSRPSWSSWNSSFSNRTSGPSNGMAVSCSTAAVAPGSGAAGVSSPGRRVTRFGRVLDRMGATTLPPKAGFSWTKRPSASISRSMASPVRPSPSLAASREARSRPSAVAANNTA